MKITSEYIQSLLRYSPETGEFFWLVSRGSVRSGKRAGGLNRGYIQIRVNKKFYKAHRLAWLVMTGAWPKGRLDHKNGIIGDNRWCNLRRATHSQNMANRRINKNNTSGMKGVSQRKPGSYRAYVNKDGKRFYLGSFASAEAAHSAYLKKAKELHGKFARPF